MQRDGESKGSPSLDCKGIHNDPNMPANTPGNAPWVKPRGQDTATVLTGGLGFQQ